MKFSIIIPARNEEAILPATVAALYEILSKEKIEHELIVINDSSTDNTLQILEELKKIIPSLIFQSTDPSFTGFGYAIRKGFEIFTGDCAAVFMADLSDSPEDAVRFFSADGKRKLRLCFWFAVHQRRKREELSFRKTFHEPHCK